MMDISILKFSKTHEWVKLEGDIATIGISDFAQKELGDVVYVELPKVGSEIVAGKEFGVVESVKAASDLSAPISGTVVETNSALGNNPALVNQDPYGEAWMLKIKCSNLAELDSLMDEKKYKELTEIS
ncbi:MAG: glycine cleavage system protein GcvH [bacterium]|nr:glycine cleavage system protein GcvH [bacterium]